MSFRQKVIGGVRWTGFSSLGATVIKLIQLAVLAHFLSPTDFGLMAIVSVIIGWSALFLDFGISAAIIYKQNITNTQLSSLYWLNVLVSVILFFFVFSIAPYLAFFYNNTTLLPLIRILAITFIFSGLGNQFAILLQKNLKFKLLAIHNLVSVLVGFIVAVVLAVNNFGVYAIVFSTIATAVVNALLNILWGIGIYRPKFVFSWGELDGIISFGLFQMGERSINYLTSQFDVLLIGKLLGPEILGIYSIAKNISMKPFQIINPIVNKVTFPIMSMLQDDEHRLRKIFLSTINYLCSVNFPIYILVILLADGIILTFFGEKWVDAIVILQILSTYRMFPSFGNPIGTLQLAKGRADLGFYWNLALFAFVPLAIYAGSQWGIIGVASSLLILQVLLFYPAWAFLVGPLAKTSFKSYWKTVFKPFIIAFLGGFIGYLVGFVVGLDEFIVKAMLYGAVMVMTGYYLNHKYNRDFIDVMFDFVSRRK